MKKILQLILIFMLILMFTGCSREMPERYRVYYEKGSSKSGSAPVDKQIYYYEDTVIVLDKGTLENGEHLFSGWMFNNRLYQPGNRLTHYYKRDIYFTATWNDGINTPFEFIIEGNEAKIIKFTGSGGGADVIIPLKYSGKPVTGIGNDVFRNKGIKNVKLPEYLKRIGSFAFSGCDMTSIDIPDSAESIGTGAFQNNKLSEITFGSGLTSIPTGAFSGNNLLSVNLPANIIFINAGAFFNNEIEQIKIGANVEIGNDTSFGIYGASFKMFYEDGGKQAGEYNYTADNWEKSP